MDTLPDLERDLRSIRLKLDEGEITERGYINLRGRILAKMKRLNQTKEPNEKEIPHRVLY